MQNEMKLIETTSLKYIRRLVRELNATPDGFYTYESRCNRAALKRGVLWCKAVGGDWFVPSREIPFSDAYGREICASRKP